MVRPPLPGPPPALARPLRPAFRTWPRARVPSAAYGTGRAAVLRRHAAPWCPRPRPTDAPCGAGGAPSRGPGTGFGLGRGVVGGPGGRRPARRAAVVRGFGARSVSRSRRGACAVSGPRGAPCGAGGAPSRGPGTRFGLGRDVVVRGPHAGRGRTASGPGPRAGPRYTRPIGARVADVRCARSSGASSTSRPRRPAETQIVSCRRADSSSTVGSFLRWPSGEMPPRT